MGRWTRLLSLALFVGGTGRAHAQGRITGAVTAEGDRPLAGASVAVVGTGRGALTDNAGRYTIANVPAGSYQVQARLIGIMDGYLDYALARPRVFDYVFSRPRPGARRFPRDFRARRSPTLNPVADIIAGMMEKGFLKRDDIWEIAFAIWAHAHGYVMHYRAGRIALSENEFRELIHRSLRRFVHGLKE